MVLRRPRDEYWVGVIGTVLFGGFAIALAVSVPSAARALWRYDHARPCSATLISGCRSSATVWAVGTETIYRGRSGESYRLDMADGQTVEVPVLPQQWRSTSGVAFPVDIERFDGHVMKVSARGVTLPTMESPGRTLVERVPGAAAMAGLTWYAVGFASAARRTLTGRAVRPRPVWMDWARRMALATAAGGFTAGIVAAFDPVAALSTILIIDGAATTVVFAILAWRRTALLH